LAAYADRQLGTLRKRLDGFELRAHEPRALAAGAAVTLRLGSGEGEGAFEQWVTMVELPGRQVVSLTLTAPMDDLPQLAPLFERILATVKPGTARPGP
jgi:hypothetical protein